MALSSATQCDNLGNTCVELLHGIPHTRASGRRASFHTGKSRVWNWLNCELSLLVLLTRRHTCWQKISLVPPANQVSVISACVQSAESIAVINLKEYFVIFLEQKVFWNYFTFQFPSNLSCPGEVAIPEKKVYLPVQGFSWAEIQRLSRSQTGLPVACSWSCSYGCTCSYLHLNSIFTIPASLAFPFILSLQLPPHQSFCSHSWAYLVSTEL